MNLTNQQLSAIVTAMRAGRNEHGAAGAEKRRFTRMQIQAKVDITHMVDDRLGADFTALTRDISFTGIGLLQPMVAERGQQFLIRLPCGAQKSLLFQCITRYCRELASSLYEIGAEFMKEVSSQETQAAMRATDKEVERIQKAMMA